MKESIDEVVRAAAALPLYDAAYKLWTSRREYLKLGGAAIPGGKIFEILQAAHPEVSDAALKAAIQSAADFEIACTSSFKYTDGGNLGRDADWAIALARVTYPQFQENTYRLASFALALAMR
ncbi:MAG: hypothetical protein P4L83_00335 [Nevskia sp.]|nr:hypothetical protein [Nevskia sp.]